MTEATANNYLGDGYVQRSNTEFEKLAIMGLTMVFSAGDAGANSLSAPPMGVVSCNPTHAMWPAESPYVLALSATYATPAAEPICYRNLEDGGINCLSNPMGEVAVGIDRGMVRCSCWPALLGGIDRCSSGLQVARSPTSVPCLTTRFVPWRTTLHKTLPRSRLQATTMLLAVPTPTCLRLATTWSLFWTERPVFLTELAPLRT